MPATIKHVKIPLKFIRELVKKEAKDHDWQYHILPVVVYAKKLAKIYKVDQELAELAALLHDIGRIRHGDLDHNLTGMIDAEKILKDNQYPDKMINQIKQSINLHRASQHVRPKTILDKIIANADAMAHFDILPLFFYWRAKKHEFPKILEWMQEKINRDWNKKLSLPAAKKIIKPKYQAIKLILKACKQWE